MVLLRYYLIKNYLFVHSGGMYSRLVNAEQLKQDIQKEISAIQGKIIKFMKKVGWVWLKDMIKKIMSKLTLLVKYQSIIS